MTMEELTGNQEIEDYCLFYGYAVVWNRWEESLVFSRDGEDFRLKDGTEPELVLEKVKGIPQGDPLADFLEKVEYSEDEEL